VILFQKQLFLTEILRNFRSSCVKLTNFAVLGGKFAKISIRQSWGKKKPMAILSIKNGSSLVCLSW
jgi:hypothetical protein